MERRVLRPSPDLPCPCGAATHTALCAPRRSCHWFLLHPPSSSQLAVCQYAFSMAATASDPIRPSSQGVATVRYNESPAISCLVWNVTNPFQRDSAIGCSIWNVTNRFQRHFATGYSTWNAKNPFQHDSPICCSIRLATLLQAMQYSML